MNRSSTYEAIRALPGFDLEAPVAASWKLRKAGTRGFPLNLTGDDEALVPIAFAHGHADAIEPTFLCLKNAKEWIQERAREAILAHTDATGSDEEILDWYEARKGRLGWVKEQKRFRETGK